MDGDGAALMHLGNLSTVGNHAPANFNHIIINNGAHDSVGGQPTDAVHHDNFNLCQVALGLGYKQVINLFIFEGRSSIFGPIGLISN